MARFEYTRELETAVASRLVDEAFYNENTKELAVDLRDKVYVYSDVPASVAKQFEDADSAGTFYGEVIRKEFGPGKRLGIFTSIEYVPVEVEKKVVSVGDVAAKGDAVFASGGMISSATGPFHATPVADLRPTEFSLQPFPVAGVSVPKAETFKHKVTFEINGVRTAHTVEAGSVNEAIAELDTAAKMLGVTFAVKEVTVYFE